MSGASEAVNLIDKFTEYTDVDCFDIIALPKEQRVIRTGRMVEHPAAFAINRFTRSTDPWFYIDADR